MPVYVGRPSESDYLRKLEEQKRYVVKLEYKLDQVRKYAHPGNDGAEAIIRLAEIMDILDGKGQDDD